MRARMLELQGFEDVVHSDRLRVFELLCVAVYHSGSAPGYRQRSHLVILFFTSHRRTLLECVVPALTATTSQSLASPLYERSMPREIVPFSGILARWATSIQSKRTTHPRRGPRAILHFVVSPCLSFVLPLATFCSPSFSKATKVSPSFLHLLQDVSGLRPTRGNTFSGGTTVVDKLPHRPLLKWFVYTVSVVS